MVILLGLAFVPVLLKLIIKDIDKNKKGKRCFVISCGVIIALIAGLRSVNVGTLDTSHYYKLYQGVPNFSTLQEFFKHHDLLRNGFFLSEGLFYLATYYCAKVIPHPQFFILITSAFITFSAMYFIYKHSKNVMLSTVLYICLGLMTFNMNGMRQALAMSICLFAYDFAKNKKLIPFLCMILLAMLVHKTSIVFLLVYFITYLKCKPKHIIFFTVAIVLFIIFADRFAKIFDSVADKNYSDVGAFESGGYVTVLIYALVLIFALVFGWKDRKDVGFSLAFYLTILGGAFFCGRYISTQIYERISYYFFYAVLLLLPQTVSRLLESEKPAVVAIITSLSIALFAYRLYGSAFQNFTFFWG